MAKLGFNVQIGVDLAKFRADMSQAFKTLNSSTAQMKRSLKGLDDGFKAVNKSVGFLTAGLASMAVASVAKDVLYAADAFNQLKAKVQNSVDSATNVDQVLKQITDSSNRTGTAIDTVAQAFARIRPAALELGVTNKELIRFNETFQKMGTLAGATSEEVQYTMIQLSQAISSNRLGGDELRSVLEQMPPVARAIADTMKIPMSQLKDVAKEGKITADVVFDAILGKTAEVDRNFSKLPPSVSRSMNQVNNELKLLLDAINTDVNATTRFSGALAELAKFLRENQSELVSVAREVAIMTEAIVGATVTALSAIETLFTGFSTVIINSADKALHVATQTAQKIASLKPMNNMVSDQANPFNPLGGALGMILHSKQLEGLTKFAPVYLKWRSGQLDPLAEGSRKAAVNSSLRTQSLAKFTAGSVGDLFQFKSGGSRNPMFGTSSLTKSPYSGMDGGSGGGKGKGKGGSNPSWWPNTNLGLDLNKTLMEGLLGANGGFENYGQYISEMMDQAKAAISDSLPPIDAAIKKNKDLQIGLEALGATAEEKARVYNDVFKDFIDDSPIELRKMTEEATQALSTQRDILKSLNGDVDGYNSYMKELVKLQELGKVSTEQFNQAQKEAQESFGIIKKQADDFAVAIGNVTAEFGDRFFDTFIQGMRDGKLAFGEFVASALEDLAKLIFKLTVTVPIAEALTGALKGKSAGGVGKGITSFIAGLFGGHRAGGGPVDAGKTYLVGEKGPEMVTFGQPGFVTPNHALSGGGTTLNQYITIHATDSKSFENQLAEHGRYLGNVAVQAVQRQQNRMGSRGIMEKARG